MRQSQDGVTMRTRARGALRRQRAWTQAAASIGATVATSTLTVAAYVQCAKVIDESTAAEEQRWARDGCPATLPNPSRAEACMWAALRERCSKFDQCWFRCVSVGWGKDMGGGCFHGCNALLVWGRAPVRLSAECQHEQDTDAHLHRSW